MKLIKTNQSSVFDNLLNIMPDLQKFIQPHNSVNPQAAKDLFSLWKSAEEDSDKTFKRPHTLDWARVKNMQNEGLVKTRGQNKIEITEKGSNVIKTMILGDERSAFEDDNSIIDYHRSLATTQNVKMAKKHKK